MRIHRVMAVMGDEDFARLADMFKGMANVQLERNTMVERGLEGADDYVWIVSSRDIAKRQYFLRDNYALRDSHPPVFRLVALEIGGEEEDRLFEDMRFAFSLVLRPGDTLGLLKMIDLLGECSGARYWRNLDSSFLDSTVAILGNVADRKEQLGQALDLFAKSAAYRDRIDHLRSCSCCLYEFTRRFGDRMRWGRQAT